MPHPLAKVHRMFELVEPIATVTFSAVSNEAFLAIGDGDPSRRADLAAPHVLDGHASRLYHT
jgi:hypothetical protein